MEEFIKSMPAEWQRTVYNNLIKNGMPAGYERLQRYFGNRNKINALVSGSNAV